MNYSELINTENIPQHIAIIMDGNGRWAQQRGLDRSQGHQAGAATVRALVENALNLGVKYLTLYTFSTENWKRPQKEIDTILRLLEGYLDDCEKDLKKHSIRYHFLGDSSVFTPVVREKMARLERLSASGT